MKPKAFFFFFLLVVSIPETSKSKDYTMKEALQVLDLERMKSALARDSKSFQNIGASDMRRAFGEAIAKRNLDALRFLVDNIGLFPQKEFYEEYFSTFLGDVKNLSNHPKNTDLLKMLTDEKVISRELVKVRLCESIALGGFSYEEQLYLLEKNVIFSDCPEVGRNELVRILSNYVFNKYMAPGTSEYRESNLATLPRVLEALIRAGARATREDFSKQLKTNGYPPSSDDIESLIQKMAKLEATPVLQPPAPQSNHESKGADESGNNDDYRDQNPVDLGLGVQLRVLKDFKLKPGTQSLIFINGGLKAAFSNKDLIEPNDKFCELRLKAPLNQPGILEKNRLIRFNKTAHQEEFKGYDHRDKFNLKTIVSPLTYSLVNDRADENFASLECFRVTDELTLGQLREKWRGDSDYVKKFLKPLKSFEEFNATLENIRFEPLPPLKVREEQSLIDYKGHI